MFASDNDFESSVFMQKVGMDSVDNSPRLKDAIETESTSSGSDSDASAFGELQTAFKEGWLQSHGLNIACLKQREPICKQREMEQKLVQFHSRRDWVDTLHVNFAPSLCYSASVEHDFDREAAFYKQALDAVRIALPRLKSSCVPIHRPADFFAEMAKSDRQMDRVRGKLLSKQKIKERMEQARRLREERKFATKVQRTNEERKRNEKKKFVEATKKHRKGMKDQLDEMLKNAKRMQRDAEEDKQESSKSGKKNKRRYPGGKMSRKARDRKFGFGGQKKRSKKNDKKSFEIY